MTRIVALTAALVSLTLVFDAQAQDGLRSASLPERPVATTPPPARRREEPTMRERDVVGTSYVPAPQLAKAKPKTFYVIPGCYAGDTRPRQTSAPACDLSQVRVIPPW